MLVKPNTAFTGTPSPRVIGGSAWKARKMYPDPSIRIRWRGEVPSGATVGVASATAWSVLAAVARSLVQHVEPRAVGAHHLLLHDAQEHARMAERAVAAVA